MDVWRNAKAKILGTIQEIKWMGWRIPRRISVIGEFYIHGSVHRDSMLIRSNEMQQYAGVYYCKITLHFSGVYRTHHQEYIKL